MNTEIHLSSMDLVEFDVTGFDPSDRPWYTVVVRQEGQSFKLYISHEQLRELTSAAINEMMATVPTEDFYRALGNVAGLSIAQRDDVAPVVLTCDNCGVEVTTRDWNGETHYTHVDPEDGTTFTCEWRGRSMNPERFATVNGSQKVLTEVMVDDEA